MEKKTKKTTDKVEETLSSKSDNDKLLNTIFNTCKLSMNSIEDVITLAKNTNFQNSISETHAKYEVISRECQMLAKAQDITLNSVDCLTKFKNWATVQIEAFCNSSTQSLAKILYGGTCCEIAEVVVQITNCDTADKDIISLAEKLSSLQEYHIHDLKKYLSIKE
jgi:hypothetical protein